MQKITKLLEENKVLIFVLCMTALLRVPSLFEPYWYGDEAIYLTIGHAIRSGVPLYTGIHDNKPPLLYLVAAMADGNQFWFKFIALIWVLATVTVFFKLAKKVFDKQLWSYAATAMFAFLVCWPKIEGNIANAELFFLLPTIGAAFLLWEKPNNRRILAGGTLLGIAALFKMPAMLEAGIWPLVWLYEKDRQWITKSTILAAGAGIPLLLSAGYFATSGRLAAYLSAAWAQNLPYLSSWSAGGEGRGIFSMTGRAVWLAVWIAAVLIISREKDNRFRRVGIWAGIGVFAGLLSGRPYPHYLLQSAGVLAISALLVTTGKKKERVLGIITIAIFWGASRAFAFYNYPTVGYYQNFASWVAGKKDTQAYFNWFDPKVEENYQIAETIVSESAKNDKIFVWGDQPVLYALSRRLPVGKYTVKYHIKELKKENETIKALYVEKPELIVDLGNENELPGLESLLSGQYLRLKNIGGATIYRISDL